MTFIALGIISDVNSNRKRNFICWPVCHTISGLDVETARNVQTSVNLANVAQSDERMNRIETLLADFISNFKQDIYLDTGALVGGTVNAYNNALGHLAIQGANR